MAKLLALLIIGVGLCTILQEVTCYPNPGEGDHGPGGHSSGGSRSGGSRGGGSRSGGKSGGSKGIIEKRSAEEPEPEASLEDAESSVESEESVDRVVRDVEDNFPSLEDNQADEMDILPVDENLALDDASSD